MAQLSKLYLDREELHILGRYCVRIDRTIVVEPSRQLTEDTFQRIMVSKPTISKISIQNEDVVPLIEYDGPYTFERVYGVLVFKPTGS
ncbi:hypothetical protein SAMN05216353_10565 [Halobacillus alkaliphilus]|uniref:Uncharacterized protein n=1 Tax=Halobacillus alkaliphilus TaxID=396056 RepID=A0A1I2KL44_9BACI|nr:MULTISPECIES: hypothetical protein [Halobacillus]ASF40450.1 hypothetical protein CEH05_15355 [Halobacillus halophilus]SFF67695.1 hypothetical protein SAMN05216353_10565 [Halobacillus alkaliphilus]